MRAINDKFINDLLNGELALFLAKVKNKPDLFSLEIRRNYINIYYRGGSILKISQFKKGYRFHFDVNYCRNKENEKLEDHIYYQTLASMNQYDANAFISNFPLMQVVMDEWFKILPKREREFQQALQRKNSFVVDIEHQFNYVQKRGMRFDMIIVVGDKMYVTENKLGNSAIGGQAGVLKHYLDICRFLDDERLHQALIASVIETSVVKRKLGLLKKEISSIDPAKTEVMYIFGEYNQRSKALSNAVKEMNKYKDTFNREYAVKFLQQMKGNFIIDLKNAKDLLEYEY